MIRLTLEGAFAAIKPMGWLDTRFNDFRKACEGSIYNKAKKMSMATLDKVPGIIKRLREADFPIDPSDELEAVLAEQKIELWHDVQAANERADAFDAQMRELSKGKKGLYPFQRTGITWLSQKHGALLADEQGLGKTLETLAALPANAAVLVACPAVAKGVWRREVAAWRPGLRVSVLEGRGNFRWPTKGEVVVLNYDILPKVHTDECEAKRKQKSPFVKKKHLDECRDPDACKGCFPILLGQHGEQCLKAQGNIFIPAVQHLARQCKGCLSPAATVKDCTGCLSFLKDAPKDLVLVADEAHNLKNPSTIKAVAWKGLAHAAQAKAARLWALTGTPMMNRPDELWAVLQVVLSAHEVFGSYATFLQLFDATAKEYGGFSFGTPDTEAVAERIQRVMLRRLRAEVMPEMPPKTVEFLTVDVDRDALSGCDEFVKAHGGIDRILKELGKNISFETMAKVRATLAKAKTPALLEVVASYEEKNEPLVVFSAHRYPIDKLARRPGWAVITGDTSNEERSRLEDRFQAGELKGLGCTIKAGGVAMTLTRACFMVFCDREWNPALNVQADDRICRIGQTRPCLITILVADHPLDARVAEVNEEKQLLIDLSINAARDVPAEALTRKSSGGKPGGER